jgi:hypothetical protein
MYPLSNLIVELETARTILVDAFESQTVHQIGLSAQQPPDGLCGKTGHLKDVFSQFEEYEKETVH